MIALWQNDVEFVAWMMERYDMTREQTLGSHCGMETMWEAWCAGKAHVQTDSEPNKSGRMDDAT